MKTLEELLSERFGLVFNDKEIFLTAFTHTSYANEHRLLKVSYNERLEFLGDAVLQLIISQYLFAKYPNKSEGLCPSCGQLLFVRRVWLISLVVVVSTSLSVWVRVRRKCETSISKMEMLVFISKID